jgi:hypothetical protein
MSANPFRRLLATALLLLAGDLHGAELHVSPAGDDGNPGTRESPLRSLAAAQKAVRSLRARATATVTVLLHAGTYYLPETLVFAADDSGAEKAPVVFAAAPGEEAVLSGGRRLELTWEPYRGGILKAKVPPGFATDQLFVNGEPQVLARYPNYDPKAQYFNGSAADAFSRERAARWADPKGGFIHAMHHALWGDFHYVITGKDRDGNVTYEGGWQNNRRSGMHPSIRFVENIIEELDAPGEWFLDAKARLLYYYPPQSLDLSKAVVEGVRLRGLVAFRGTRQKPVRFVTLKGLTFRCAARTFLDNREPLLRSDWTIYRGGAVFFTGCEGCTLEDCTLTHLGGNAVVVSGYNRRVAVRGCHITEIGANGVAFVGDPRAVRSPLFEYGQRQGVQDIDRTPGPKGEDYPAACSVEDCLIHRTGRVEKQTAPVEISTAQGISVRYCSIYDVPRAGINVGDGCWGGHLIEFCDVFDTVKETGDHGSFNSWGRDRYWGLKGVDLNRIADDPALRDLPLLDAVKPVVLRHNRWRCDHGWDIDLDDGSTNYRITNNLSLHGGIKLREGFRRVCENNVIVDNSLHPHVWFADSGDVVRRNIVFTPYRPVRVPKPWGEEWDFNLLHHAGMKDAAPARTLQKQSGQDEHSLEVDALFLDAKRGDYRVAGGSPALRLGFRSFPTDQFGVRKPELRKIARTPPLPEGGDAPKGGDSKRNGRTRG